MTRDIEVMEEDFTIKKMGVMVFGEAEVDITRWA